jgi:Domain of unknown function (DUF4249)
MLKISPKSLIILTAVFTLSTCIDPYSPKLKGYDSILVVDGLITDENSACTIKLSKTLQDQNTVPVVVSDATINITDDEGNSSQLNSMGGGIYKTDSTAFKGIIGRSYTLHITTHDGNEYESVPCLMQPVPDIDSVYFEKDVEIVNNGTESQEGIRIYLDSKPGDNNEYYRWSFDETWKFKVPFPKKYNYIDTITIIAVDKINEYCWKNRKSSEILIRSIYSGQNPQIEKEPIFFIATDQSDRLMIEYSILVKQYSISKNEYDFWDNLKLVNESGGDIFASQPFEVISNIQNINNPNERVLGYFQVSAVKQKRKYILFADMASLQLPFFHPDCVRIARGPQDYPRGSFTFDDIYRGFPATAGYVFVEPIYKAGGTQHLERLVFTKFECADCELTGTSARPDFWIDLK